MPKVAAKQAAGHRNSIFKNPNIILQEFSSTCCSMIGVRATMIQFFSWIMSTVSAATVGAVYWNHHLRLECSRFHGIGRNEASWDFNAYIY